MKTKIYKIATCFSVLAVMFAVTACDDGDDAYKKYIPEDGTSYLGKAHSVVALPGNKRLQLSWQLSADPHVRKAKVFWNNGRDSLEIPVSNSGEPQEISILIEGLEERKYSFEIYTYDDIGNRSLPVEVNGEAYGDSYISGLANRSIASLELTGGQLYIGWETLTGNSQTGKPLGVDLKYVGSDGDGRQTRIALADYQTILSDIKSGSAIEYRTMYLPDSSSIDTFYSASTRLEVPLYSLLDKTQFTKLVLPTDNTTLYNASYPMEQLWDGDTGSIYYTARDSGVPTWFTFDLGHVASLRRVRYNQRTSPESVLWSNNNPRKFEIWGTAGTPDPDGGWTGWTKLADIESVKPSGLPPGENTDEAIAVAESGEEFDFPSGIPPVRYIRIKVNETWSNSQAIHIAELTFWED